MQDVRSCDQLRVIAVAESHKPTLSEASLAA